MIVNKITSTFGDHSSLLPLFTKDVVNSAGMTAFSYEAGGKIEGKDRFIDEFGTQAIWLGGLPFFKWAFDKTAYKLANISSDVDVRLLKNKEQLAVAQKYVKSLKDSSFAQKLNHAVKNEKLAKGLFLGKFAAATVLTLASYFTLVKVKQGYTKKQIEKQFWAKKSEQSFYKENVAKSPAFKAFMGENTQQNSSKNVSFKGIGSALSKFMFDPVKNLFIVDAGITGERLMHSRTKNEFVEYSIKEGGFLFFMYVAGKYIQNGIEKLSAKFGKPIELHAEVLSSKFLNNNIASGKAIQDANIIKNFLKNADKKGLYEFIYDSQNAENTVIKAAKQSGIIETLKTGNWFQKMIGTAKDTGIINPYKFIDATEIESIANNITKIANKAPKEKVALEKFLKSCAKFKVGSVAANMGISCLFLGLVLPYVMMKYRSNQQNGNTDFHVQAEIEKQLEMNFKGRIA